MGLAARISMLGFWCCCCTQARGAETEQLQCEIYAGAASPALPLTNSQLTTIVRVGFAEQPDTLCSGIAILPEWVITAGHCVEQRPSTVTVESAGTLETHAVLETIVNEAVDIGLLRIEPLEYGESFPLSEAPLDASWLGELVQLAGYGLTEEGTVGALKFALEPVVGFDETTVVVDGHGNSGACVGDSGGPLLARGDDGRVQLIGILDRGSATCLHADRYTRVDRLTDWIAEKVGPIAPTRHGCGDVPPEGVCFRNKVVRCAEGLAAVRTCDLGHCGWDVTQGRFACLDASDDPCAGISDFGACEEGAAVRCDRGRLKREVCSGHCGAECTISPTSGRAECQAP